MTTENKKENRNKKKMLIIALFIFAVVGIAGYGVYSYYWTEGKIEGSDTITIASFDPRVSTSSSESFLGNGGTATITCPALDQGSTTCTGEVTVSNSGSTSVEVEITEPHSSFYGGENLTTNVSSPDISFGSGQSSIVLDQGETSTVYISVPVSISGADEIATNTPTYTSSPVGGEVRIDVDFKLTATQLH